MFLLLEIPTSFIKCSYLWNFIFTKPENSAQWTFSSRGNSSISIRFHHQEFLRKLTFSHLLGKYQPGQFLTGESWQEFLDRIKCRECDGEEDDEQMILCDGTEIVLWLVCCSGFHSFFFSPLFTMYWIFSRSILIMLLTLFSGLIGIHRLMSLVLISSLWSFLPILLRFPTSLSYIVSCSTYFIIY